MVTGCFRLFVQENQKNYWKQPNLNTPRKRESFSLYLVVMGKHDNAEETDSVRPIQYSTSDIILAFTPAPTPRS